MSIENFLRDPISLIAAIGALLASVASLLTSITSIIKVFRPRTERKTSRPKQSPPEPSLLRALLKMPAFFIGVLLLLVSLGIFAGRSMLPPLPRSLQLTQDAWDAFNTENYPLALDKADDCTQEFEGEAIRVQRRLIESGSPAPPVGEVSEADKQEILANGVLNDVATCYFIMGEALTSLNRANEAKEAFQNAAEFPYARTWDPGGWFWSPADVAGDRLTRLP